jgi:hypothetical protein
VVVFIFQDNEIRISAENKVTISKTFSRNAEIVLLHMQKEVKYDSLSMV